MRKGDGHSNSGYDDSEKDGEKQVLSGVGRNGHDSVKEVYEKVEQEGAVNASDTEFLADDEERNHE